MKTRMKGDLSTLPNLYLCYPTITALVMAYWIRTKSLLVG